MKKDLRTITLDRESHEKLMDCLLVSASPNALIFRDMLADWEKLPEAPSSWSTRGGQAKSAAKTKAVRENAKKGGRPKKYRVFQGRETDQVDTIEGEKAIPYAWYWEPADFTGSKLWSPAFSSFGAAKAAAIQYFKDKEAQGLDD